MLSCDPAQNTCKYACFCLFYVFRQRHAIGNRETLSKVASECQCDEEWLWRIITDYGLFVVSAEALSSRSRKRGRAL